MPQTCFRLSWYLGDLKSVHSQVALSFGLRFFFGFHFLPQKHRNQIAIVIILNFVIKFFSVQSNGVGATIFRHMFTVTGVTRRVFFWLFFHKLVQLSRCNAFWKIFSEAFATVAWGSSIKYLKHVQISQ